MNLPAGAIIRAVLALVLGVATWTAVTWEQNPFHDDWLGSPVQIEVSHLPTGLVEVGKPGDVRIRLRASQDAWGRIKPDDFKASVDLSKQTAGIHSVDVKVETSGEYQVVDWDPRKVTIRLEPLDQASVPVQLRMTGSLPDGYVLRGQSVTPDQVTVTGEQDLVQKITRASVLVNLNGVNGNVSLDATPTLLDDHDQAITGVQFSPATIRVSLGVDRQVGVKTVPVRVTTTGQVAPGYWLSALTVNPQTVTITGGPNALSQVDYIELPPLDLAGAKADVNRSTQLAAGKGYSLLSDSKVDVKAVVQPLRTTEVLPIGVAIQGVPEGLEAKASPPMVDVTIGGPVPALSVLKPGDVSAVVNVSGLPAGSHSLPVRLNAPAAVSLDATNPASVTVTLAPPATATPIPTAGSTPQPTPSVTPTSTPNVSPTPTISPTPTPRR